MERHEAEAIFEDESKYIEEDIIWEKCPDKSTVQQFRAQLYTPDVQLIMMGTINHLIEKLSFVILHPTEGRIYALDFGHTHKNDDQYRCGELHKHRWRPEEPTWAYEPDDITAGLDDLPLVWRQFCQEAKILHMGRFFEPTFPKDLFDND